MTTTSAPLESTSHNTRPHWMALGTALARPSVLGKPGGGLGGGLGWPPVSDSEPQAQRLPDTHPCGGRQPSRCWHVPDAPWAQGRICTCWCHGGWHFSPVGCPDKELANLQVRRNEACYTEFCHPPLSKELPCCFPYFLLKVSKIQFYVFF